MSAERTVGIVVMPDYFQTEGVDAVLDTLIGRAGVTAVCTAPYVSEPCGDDSGSREPPPDAGAGGVRLLDRPLWGRRELRIRTAPSFAPERSFYEGLRYQPPVPDDLTVRDGAIVGRFLVAARARGLKTYVQIMAAAPPGYRVQLAGVTDDDQPRLPDGRLPVGRVDGNGSLASPNIQAYTTALIRDLCRAYPDVDGFRVDWPEYPPYSMDSLFLDFSGHAMTAAKEFGIDAEAMRRDALSLYRTLHGGLTDAMVDRWTGPGGWDAVMAAYPGIGDLLRLKASLCGALLDGFRAALDDAAGPGAKELIPNAFPPPWSRASGMHFERLAGKCDGFAVKLYTMHWPMMLRFYGDQLLAANPGLSSATLARALIRATDVADDWPVASVADFAYPEPDEAHPAGLAAQARKVAEARRRAGATPVYVLAHGYGPAEDVRRRVRLAHEASGGRIWVNRYGYLSDEKLDIIGAETRP
ncbi:MAG: hypothetical protein ACTS3R_12405 [Inquilinaceae bacterium]